MGFSSPYGNRPSALPSPIPSGMTLASLQQAAAIPNLPTRGRMPVPSGAGLSAPATSTDLPGAPSATPTPAPQPSPSPSPAPNGMSADEMKDLQSLSDQELADLKELDAANPSLAARFGRYLKKHAGEIIGGTVGGTGGAILTGGLGGELGGAAFGAAMGEKIQKYVQGDPQPGLGDSLETGLMNAGGVAAVGALSRIAGGAASGFIQDGVKAAAESTLGTEAAQAAKGRLEDARNLGVPALSYQTGEGTVLGAQAASEGQKVMAGQRGPVPQAQLVQAQAEQEAGIQSNLERLRNMFSAQNGRTPAPGEKMGHLNQELQPHEFAQGWLDRYHGLIDYVKGRAKEVFGDRQFDVSRLMTDVEVALKRNNIIDDAGRPTAKVGDLSGDERQLYNLWKSMGQATTRRSAFGAQGGAVPGMSDVFPGQGPGPVASHVQDPLHEPPSLPLFGATGRAGSVAGPTSGMPEVNMTQLKPGGPGGPLGPQTTTDLGFQPNLPGQSPNTSAPAISMLPPNAAGPGVAGVSFQTLDNIVSKIQNLAAAGQKSASPSYLQSTWDDLSKNATTAFHDVIRDNLGPADPEAANLLARVDKLYSGYVDTVRDMANQIRSNPSAAVKVFVDKNNPAATSQAFHFLTQEQGDVVRRQIMVDSFEKAMLDGGKGASAEKMLEELKSYGSENLDTIFGNQKGDVLNALDAMRHLQNTQLKPAAQAANLRRIEDAASKSGVIRHGLDIFNSLLNKNKDLQKYIGSPDFQAKILRKSKLYEQTLARKAATQVGKDFTGSGIGVQGKELINGNQ